MRILRTVIALSLLTLEAGLAALGVSFHYGLVAEYGNITDSALSGFARSFSEGIGGLALVIVGAVAVAAALVSPRLWQRLLSAAFPVLMLAAMLAVTPVAQREKLATQYDDTPHCVNAEEEGASPGLDAQRASQRAFDSIEHVGHFGGGGGSGVGGCDRSFELTEDVDVLRHYRSALPEAGWRVVEDDALHLRAEQGEMAFEVFVCGSGGVVWAGSDRDDSRAGCEY